MTEQELEAQILDYLNRLPGWFAIKAYSTGIFDPKRGVFRSKNKFAVNGISDILAVYKGQFIAIEVKLPGNKPTEAQLAFLNKVARCGGHTTWVTSLENLLAFVKEI